jgi:hypothetical protein
MSVIKITIRQLLLNCYNLKPNLEMFYIGRSMARFRMPEGASHTAPEGVAAQRARGTVGRKERSQVPRAAELRYTSASPRSGGTILEQLELELSDPEEDASEAEATAQIAAARTRVEVRGFARRKPARRPLPEHLVNTYGPRMHPNDGRVVSNFIVQALLGRDITVYGDGSQTPLLPPVSRRSDRRTYPIGGDVSGGDGSSESRQPDRILCAGIGPHGDRFNRLALAHRSRSPTEHDRKQRRPDIFAR